ncbi:hypothetical protein IJ750_05815 [bacterium]|nr:hypothetical protein [bacterium]MBR1776570.1 hypothetical protein [bacterium]
MRKSTFTKTALTLMALGVFASGAMAAGDEQANDSVQYQLTLADYLKIDATTQDQTSTVTFGENYSSISIDSAMTGTFSVISNASSKVLYLQGTNTVSGAQALYSNDGDATDDLHIVFTKVGGVAADGDVTNAASSAPSKASNKDAISFKIQPTVSHAENSASGITPAWDNEKKQVAYTMKNGTGTYSYLISGSADNNTFSTHDSSGTYQATLTLTNTSL